MALAGALVKRYVDNWLQKQTAASASELESFRQRGALELERQRTNSAISLTRAEDELESIRTVKKRVYLEMSPLLFQIGDDARVALNAIRGVASTYRTGDESARSSLDELSTRWRAAVVYSLLAPVAHANYLQHRLTILDVSVDQEIRERYFFVAQVRRDWLSLLALDKSKRRLVDRSAALVLSEMALDKAVASVMSGDISARATMPIGRYLDAYLVNGSKVRGDTAEFEAAIFDSDGPLSGEGWKELTVIAGSMWVLSEGRFRVPHSTGSVNSVLSPDVLDLRWSDDPACAANNALWLDSGCKEVNSRLSS